MDQDVTFNLQSFLNDMRNELRDSHNALVIKVDAGFQRAAEAHVAHETADAEIFAAYNLRVSHLENGFAIVRWVLMSAGGASIVLGLNWFVTWWRLQ